MPINNGFLNTKFSFGLGYGNFEHEIDHGSAITNIHHSQGVYAQLGFQLIFANISQKQKISFFRKYLGVFSFGFNMGTGRAKNTSKIIYHNQPFNDFIERDNFTFNYPFFDFYIAYDALIMQKINISLRPLSITLYYVDQSNKSFNHPTVLPRYGTINPGNFIASSILIHYVF